jgi:hypothetical protein
MLLVVCSDVEKIARLLRKGGYRRQKPGPEAVGIGCDLQRHTLPVARGGKSRQVLKKGLLQDANVLHVAIEPSTGFGRGARLAVLDQDRAQSLFQVAHPLRDGRLRDVQDTRRALEAAGLHDHRNGTRSGIVEHDDLS